MFFHYSQNNSGGGFDFDEATGITHHVVIEAKTAAEANSLAEQKGLYFDGCDSGRDCPCCGDRWGCASDTDGTPEPTVYGRPANAYASASVWMKPGHEIAVHYKDGRTVWFGVVATKL